jgi:hypothetical protein
MKKKIIICALSFFLILGCKKNVENATNNLGTQIILQTNVPAAVLNTFNASFSKSTEREWRYEDDQYICQFNMNSQRQETAFDDNGHQDHHSVICLDAAVPQVVLAAFRSNFPNDFVYEWKFTNDSNWKAHFMRSEVKYEITINTNGSILKSEHD